MTNWMYDGYTKVHGGDRQRMIEQWIWKCSVCGYTIRKPFGNNNIPKTDCPVCLETQREDETASDMRNYCERYEQTYNPGDGSM